MGRKKRRRRSGRSHPRARSRVRLAVLLGAGAAGALISGWLVWVHYRLLSAPGAGSACNFGGFLNCDAVNTSRFSDVLGVPIAYGGLVFYLALGAMAASELFGSARPRALAYARGLGAAALAYSLFLAVVSFAVIQALCVFCAALYLLNAAIAALGWWRPPSGTRFFVALDADLCRLFGGFSVWRVQAAAILAVAGAIGLARLGEAVPSTAAAPASRSAGDIPSAPGHADGPDHAALTVAVFSDFECPFCARASRTLSQLRHAFDAQVRFVYKHFPLDAACNRSTPRGAHDGACDVAASAVCAGEQGRFWEYHDRVFERGTEATVTREIAEELDLDMTAWHQCRWGRPALTAVEQDIEDGLGVGVRTTPTFLVGGSLVVGARPYETLAAIIRRELRLATRRQRPRSGRPPEGSQIAALPGDRPIHLLAGGTSPMPPAAGPWSIAAAHALR